jgi:hypothetical protein
VPLESRDEDRNHFGRQFNPLMSESENLKTRLEGTDSKSKELRRMMQRIEMNVGTEGRDNFRRTREGYRDEHKTTAFRLMDTYKDSLKIHDRVVYAAKILFAKFRQVGSLSPNRCERCTAYKMLKRTFSLGSFLVPSP